MRKFLNALIMVASALLYVVMAQKAFAVGSWIGLALVLLPIFGAIFFAWRFVPRDSNSIQTKD